MKKAILILLGAVALLLTNIYQLQAQPKAVKQDIPVLNNKALKAINTTSYASFKKTIKPLIKEMGVKKIVALGEGTHGTAEFYKLRFWISRILVEDKCFDHIAFENDYSDCWLLNSQLNKNTNLDSLMKKHMLSIWQNQETKELLQWVKAYNTRHAKKVTISGIDYVFASPDIALLRELLRGTSAASALDSIAPLARAANFQDEAWNGLNRRDYKLNFDSLAKSSYHGYLLAAKLGEKLAKANLPQQTKTDVLLAITNLQQAFAPFYSSIAKKPEASRDSNMAYTTSVIMQKPNAKMIIWAHDGHVAKKAIYKGAVGGTGGYLRKMYPGDYFVLGTGTATGTFAATTESRDTYTNPMKAYKLDEPLKDSWEEEFVSTGIPAFYFIPAQYNTAKTNKQMRFVGYTPKSGASTYDNINITDWFDAYLFIKYTNAATPLN